jgi:hypothetical protein
MPGAERSDPERGDAPLRPSSDEHPKCSPCNRYRICISPMFCMVWGIVGINYAPYVLWTPHTTWLSWISLVVFHVLLFMLLASYLHCVFTDPGTVPQAWSDRIASDPQQAARYRYCHKSGLYRPPRSHYCSVTQRVVLNMDHFCPWVVNTVGYYNRKYFVLFLLYTLATCSWVLATFVPHFLDLATMTVKRSAFRRGWTPGMFMISWMAMLMDTTLVLMLLCFATFHVRMVLLNETTIEGPSPVFDVGRRKNWESVFGKEPLYWFLPLWGTGPCGDGVHWPTADDGPGKGGEHVCDNVHLLDNTCGSDSESV